MGVHELEKSFAIQLTTRHQPSGRELAAVKMIRFHSGGEAWLRPPILDEPGEWFCSMAVVGKDDDTPVGTPWSVTLTVAEAVRYDSFRVGIEGDREEKARLGEALPPLVVTALDAVESPFTLPELPLLQVIVEIVWQPQGQQLQIDEARPQIVMKDGEVRLEHLVLRGTLNGKSSGSIKFSVTLGDLPQYKTDKLDVKCGQPATLELESPDELQSAGPFDADASLPALRLHCKDQDGNPCGGALTPKRSSSGQLYSEGARGTPSGTRRARDKLISVLACNKGVFASTFPQSSPSQKREGRPCRPHEGCQVGLIVIR